jgi:O-antigen/teichoic acid export membrane protein
MRNILLVVFVVACTVLAIPSDGFTNFGAPVNDGATWFCWMFFGIPIIGLISIPWLKRLEYRNYVRRVLKTICLN